LGRSSSWSRNQCVSARRRWRQSARRCQNPKHGSSLLPACFSSVDVGVARDGRLNLASALIKTRCRVVTERKKIVILVARVTHRLDAPRPQAARTCQRRRTHRRGNWQDNDRRGEANQGRRGVGSATAHTTSFLSRVLGPGPAVSALAASQPTLRCPPVPGHPMTPPARKNPGSPSVLMQKPWAWVSKRKRSSRFPGDATETRPAASGTLPAARPIEPARNGRWMLASRRADFQGRKRLTWPCPRCGDD
jgi:hypothetical protein